MVALRTLASGSTTATVGMAWSSVHSRKRALESSRARIPVITTSTAATPATTAKMPNFRRETGGVWSVGMQCLRNGGGLGALLLAVSYTHLRAHETRHD